MPAPVSVAAIVETARPVPEPARYDLGASGGFATASAAPGLAGPAPGGVDGQVFRRALARCGAGVVIVTVTGGPGGLVTDAPAGLTVSSFTSVSLSPPLVSFCVDGGAGCWPRLRDCAWFTVNVLTETQAHVAARFARPGVDRFAPPTRWHRGPGGAALLDGCAAYLYCRTYDLIALGDHFLVVGLLTAAGHGADAAPLLHHAGQYGRFRQVG